MKKTKWRIPKFFEEKKLFFIFSLHFVWEHPAYHFLCTGYNVCTHFSQYFSNLIFIFLEEILVQKLLCYSRIWRVLFPHQNRKQSTKSSPELISACASIVFASISTRVYCRYSQTTVNNYDSFQVFCASFIAFLLSDFIALIKLNNGCVSIERFLFGVI